MTASVRPLPGPARLIFAVLEPLSLFGGFFEAWRHPDAFITEQFPPAAGHLAQVLPHSRNAYAMALQLGNVYALMGLTSLIVLPQLSTRLAVRSYIGILALGDLGHLYATWAAIGTERFMAIADWNVMAWGNIGVVVILFALRLMLLGGLLGASVDAPQNKSIKLK